ncbi:MAG: hypothetical protein ACRDWI_20260 [Jiangellaceae bacterium]
MDLHELIEACHEAAAGEDPALEVADLLGGFLRQRDLSTLVGTGDRSIFEAVHRSDDLLLLHAVIPPIPAPVDPHNHRMWAVVGVYQGQEDTQLFTRTDDDTLEPTERFSVAPGDVRALDVSAIHSIQPGRGEYLGALHIYGGDLLATPRSSWRGGIERPYDETAVLRLFDGIRRHEDELGRPMTADETATLLAATTTT